MDQSVSQMEVNCYLLIPENVVEEEEVVDADEGDWEDKADCSEECLEVNVARVFRIVPLLRNSVVVPLRVEELISVVPQIHVRKVVLQKVLT